MAAPHRTNTLDEDAGREDMLTHEGHTIAPLRRVSRLAVAVGEPPAVKVGEADEVGTPPFGEVRDLVEISFQAADVLALGAGALGGSGELFGASELDHCLLPFHQFLTSEKTIRLSEITVNENHSY